MRYNRIRTCLLTAILGIIALASCSSPRCGTLVWKESFNGNQLDTLRWSKIGRGASDWNRHMSSYDSCYDFRRGKLVLRGIRNTALPDDTASVITGGVYTKGKVGFSTGRLEIRAKLGEARGAWPAFWMLPENGSWPKGGEIDIMEHLNNEDIAYQTVHSYYTLNLKQDQNPPHGGTGIIKSRKFNTYAVEITEDSLAFFINKKRTFTYPRLKEKEDDGQFVFADGPFYLLLDMQLGGNWVGKIFPEDLPVEMEIDWVKYYSLQPTPFSK